MHLKGNFHIKKSTRFFLHFRRRIGNFFLSLLAAPFSVGRAGLKIVKRFFPRRRHVAKIFLYVAASAVLGSVAVALFAAPFIVKAKLLYREASQGRTSVEAAQEAALELDFFKAGNELASAEKSFTQAREGLDDFAFFRRLPWFGKQIEAVDSILLTSMETASALSDIVSLGSDMFEVIKNAALLSGNISLPEGAVSFDEITREEKRRILKSLFEAPPLLQGAKAKIDLALAAFEGIPQDKIVSPIRQAMHPIEEKLPELRRVISEAIPASEILPQILGYPKPKTYLFLLQNNSELRPTGGFIGTYGILKLDSAEIATFATDNIYKLDWLSDKLPGEPAPAPIQKYLEVKKWFLRDANWSPDFPTSAKKAEELYLKEIAPHLGLIDPKDPWYATVEPSVDGVIAMTPEVMKDILRIVGEVRIEDQVFTSENLVDVLEYQVGRGFAEQGAPDIQRKQIIGKLAEEVKNRLFRLPATEWPKVLDVIRRALDEKNILMYDKSPQLQELIHMNNWDGAAIDTDGDYLMVVDANMASLKTDSFVRRRVDYAMAQQGGAMTAKATLTYTNTGAFDWKTTRYRTYTRLYVPRGSELVSAIGMMENDKIKDPARKKGKADVSEDLGKTVFGFFLSVEPGETRTVTVEYRLPEGVRELMQKGIYNFYAQKQPGAGDPPLTASFVFDTTVRNWLPYGAGKKAFGGKALRFETDLRLDRAFGVRF